MLPTLRDLTYSFHPLETDGAIESWLRGASQRPDVGWTRTELETHVRDEHSTFTWLLEPMLKGAERLAAAIQAARRP